MTRKIAIAGKGGTGKTTLAALITTALLRSGQTPVLVIDADPNTNLPEALGVTVTQTVAGVITRMMAEKEKIPAGMTKDRYLDRQFQDALAEAAGFDLLAMGHTEGPGCYCSPNHLLREIIDQLQQNYPWVVMDNEAGMEHLSRRTTRDLDALLIVANPTPVSLKTAGRIYRMAQDLQLEIPDTRLVLACIAETHAAAAESTPTITGLPRLGIVPFDPDIVRLAAAEKPLLDLPDDSPALQAVSRMLTDLSGNSGVS